MKNRLAFVVMVIRHRPLSLCISVLLTLLLAGVTGVPVAVALLLWVVSGMVSGLTQPLAAGLLLRWAGCRQLNRLEAERVTPVVHRRLAAVLVCDAAQPWLVHCQGRVVVSVGLLDVLEDRALLGFLAQATQPPFVAAQAGESFVWSALLPLVCGWWFVRFLGVVGRILAVLIGWSLLVPMIVWPDGFVRWAGRALGSLLLTTLVLMLVGGGLFGAALLVFVCAVGLPLMRAVMTWEWSLAEIVADRATVDAGLGAHLMDALETLAWIQPPVAPGGVLGLLFRPGGPLARRADRVWRALRES